MIMQILIMRHGDAALQADNDAARKLTDKGWDEVAKVACRLRQDDVRIDQVLVSPYLRTQQTLAAMRTLLPLPEQEEILSELTPAGNSIAIINHLQQLAVRETSVLLISHLPLVGYLFEALLPQYSPPIFTTSTIVRIQYDWSTWQGRLDWTISPELLS